MVHVLSLPILSFAFLAAPLPAAAENANEVFQSLFGDEWKKVQATRETADDLALAQTLLAAAKTSKSQVELSELLCNQAYTLASRDTTKAGCDLAVASMKQLAELVPAKADAANDKTIAVLKARFSRAEGEEKSQIGTSLIASHIVQGKALESAGDFTGAVKQYQSAKVLSKQFTSPLAAVLDTLIDSATQRDRIERKIAQLEEKVAADPTNKAQRLDLISLYVQLDKPAAAVAHAQQSGDADIAKWIPLAVKKIAEVPIEECGKLGEWYRSLAPKAENDAARRIVLNRSSLYLQRLINEGKKDELAVVKAKLTIGRVKEDLAKLDAAATTTTTTKPPIDLTKKPERSEEIDLIKLVDPAKDATEGRWEKGNGKVGITVDSTSNGAWLDLPVLPQGDYEFQVTFSRATGRAVAKIFVPITPKGGLKNGESSSYTPGVAITLGMDDGKVGAIENGIGNSYYGYYFEESSFKNAIHSRALRFSNGKSYAMKIKVEHEKDEAKVTVLLGGEKYLAWRGDPASSNVSVYRKGMPAVAVYSTVPRSSAVFSNASVQAQGGEVKKVREEK